MSVFKDIERHETRGRIDTHSSRQVLTPPAMVNLELSLEEMETEPAVVEA